jgi:signal transduction histidine kinase
MRLSLRTKSGLFLVGYTLALEGSILTYFHISGRETVQRQSNEQVRTQTDLARAAVERALADSLAELGALRAQLSPLRQPGGQAASREPLAELAVAAPSRYARLGLHNPQTRRTLSVRTVREFRGTYPLMDEFTETAPSPEPPSGQLRITLPLGSAGSPVVVADVYLDDLLDPLAELTPPPGVRVLASDASGLILYAEDPSLLRTYVNNAGMPAGGAMHRQRIARPELEVIAVKDQSADLAELRGRLLSVASFTVLATLLAFAGVWALTGRMAHSMRQVVATADRVAHGDFSPRITLRRNDELGDLIDSINGMTGRLETSYRDLSDLNTRLKAKVAELSRTRRRLSEKQRLAAVGEAMSKMSHEIQNRIGGVGVWVQNLERMGGRDENTLVCVAEMKTALNGFLDMLVHFKRFYRQPVVTLGETDASAIMSGSIERVDSHLRARGVTAAQELALEPLLIPADPQQFADALVNLLINAIEASPPGGAIQAGVRGEDGFAIFSIRDQGPGLPAKGQLFRPFFTTKASGSGLGLSIARNIVRAHAGQIRAFNHREGGACFEIRLPVATGKENSDEHTAGRG